MYLVGRQKYFSFGTHLKILFDRKYGREGTGRDGEHGKKANKMTVRDSFQQNISKVLLNSQAEITLSHTHSHIHTD